MWSLHSGGTYLMHLIYVPKTKRNAKQANWKMCWNFRIHSIVTMPFSLLFAVGFAVLWVLYGVMCVCFVCARVVCVCLAILDCRVDRVNGKRKNTGKTNAEQLCSRSKHIMQYIRWICKLSSSFFHFVVVAAAAVWSSSLLGGASAKCGTNSTNWIFG